MLRCYSCHNHVECPLVHETGFSGRCPGCGRERILLKCPAQEAPRNERHRQSPVEWLREIYRRVGPITYPSVRKERANG